MEKGDGEALQLWDVIRTLSVQEFKKIYDRLGIKFDHYDGTMIKASSIGMLRRGCRCNYVILTSVGESLYTKSWVEGTLEELRRAGLLVKDDKGREVVSVSPKGQVRSAFGRLRKSFH